MERTIELIYFDGCPHVGRARENLEAALRRLGAPLEWREWNLADSSTPARASVYGSPTVLVDGRDVTGAGEEVHPGGLSCRADGAPSVTQIESELSGLE